MSGINFGTTAAAAVYVGDTTAVAVYVGDELVWQGANPERPKQFLYDFTTKSARPVNAGANDVFSDSGHQMFVTGTMNGRIFASSKDGTMVFSNATTGAGATYLCANVPNVVYGYMRYRFVQNAGTTKSMAVGAIGFTSVNPNSSAYSSLHLVIEENQAYIQRVDGGSVGATLGGPWSFADTGEAWRETEWAVFEDTVVIRLPDGSVESFSHSLVETYVHNWFVMEPVRTSTDWEVEIAEGSASNYAGMTPENVLYYNNLLAEASVGPYVPIDPEVVPYIKAYGVASGTTGGFAADYIEPDGHTSYELENGDVVLKIAYNDDSTSNPTVFTGTSGTHTEKGAVDGSNQSATLWEYIPGASGAGETDTGETSAAGDQIVAIVFGNASGIGAVQTSATGTNPFPVPSLSLNVTDGTSRVIWIFLRRNDASPQLVSNKASPSGMERVCYSEPGGSVNSMAGAYITTDGVSSFSSRSYDNGEAANHVSLAIEILAE